MGRYRGAGVALGLAALAAGCSGASPNAPEVVQVSPGGFHTCALLADGTVRCWGQNTLGQLGDGTHENRWTPTAVSSLSGVTAIAAGGYHTCALLADGTARCWGWGNKGALGNGSEESRATPVQVIGIEGAATVAAPGASILSTMYRHTCALRADATVRCWGANEYGQLGNGEEVDAWTADPVLALTGVRSISAGNYHTCALLENGSARCWGRNDFGQLGSPGPYGTCVPSGQQQSDCAKTPVAVSTTGLGDAISAGGSFTLLLSGGPVVAGWGRNDHGQLAPFGAPIPDPQFTPTTLAGFWGVGALTAGGGHACALHLDRGVTCWGLNVSGQVGLGAPGERAAGAVEGLDAISVVAGSNHTCAVTRGRGLRCWGMNWYGQLGDGTASERNGPVPVVGFER